MYIHSVTYIKSLGTSAALFAVMLALLLPFTSQAQSEAAASPQEQCFVALKETLAETNIFAEPLLELGNRSYADIEALFGEKKMMLSSFDVTVDQPILGIRLYSFGNQTGYTHPPKTVLPIYTKSDTWGEPVREYVLAEEYVTDTEGKQHFLNCVFLHIESDQPLSVTQDKYAFDGTSVSLVKTAPDGSYKAWYNQAPGFDFEDKHFVTWKRLIVYPETTKNTYFSRFDVIDAYPANKLANFEALDFFNDKSVSYTPVEFGVPEATYTNTLDGVVTELPPELRLRSTFGINFSYRLASYYQAIQAQFPEFATLLSMQGAIKYSTYQELVTKTDLTEDEMQFTALIFGDTRELDTYYFDENKAIDPEKDKVIGLIQDGDATLDKLAAGEAFAELIAPEVEPAPALPASEKSSAAKMLLGALTAGAAFAIAVLVYILRRRQTSANTTEI